ncbi:MAG: cytochrome c [Candidatus Omnitrophica bacterium]|nr:cytochrome c [Candidatus Omnitrophota bacterium]
MKKLAMTILIAAAVASISARAADDAKAKAKTTYMKLCKGCHGVDGKGDTTLGRRLGVLDYTQAKVQDAVKDEEMFKAIKEGYKKNGRTLMRPFGERLNDEEIKALVAYFRDFKKK